MRNLDKAFKLGCALLGAAALGLSNGGCTNDAFCFDCGDAGLGPNEDADINDLDSGVGGGLNLDSGSGGAGTGGSGLGGTPGDGGAGGNGCTDTQNDPFNCGACGNVCDLQGAFPACVEGKCQVDECLPGRQDLNGLPNDGCEHACAETNDGVEICDAKDNDCDGEIDEDFDLTTVEHCGGCNIACGADHASVSCENVGTTDDPNFQCAIADCEEGFQDIDTNYQNGCEYGCTPSGAETCNGLDDDCDGSIDEAAELSDVGVPCDDICPNGNCQGICTAGETVCRSGSLRCEATATTVRPGVEVCGGGDEDCDGEVDEGFDTTSDVNNCGGCDIQCNIPNAFEKCENSQCAIDVCQAGFANLLTDDPEDGCEYECPVFPTTAETCNGVDDDCDGLIDTADPDLVTPDNFCVQTGPCSGAVPECNGAAGEWQCNYAEQDDRIELSPTAGTSTAELLCDGFDGNCNGLVDENLGAYETCTANNQCGSNDCEQADASGELGGRCTCTDDSECSEGFLCDEASEGGDGLCHPLCVVGVGTCGGQALSQCAPDGIGAVCDAVAQPFKARDEVCDGEDNNCDGEIDEREPAPGSLCYTDDMGGGEHDCQGHIDEMIQVGGVYMYQYEASRPGALIDDSGLDETRACSVPSVLPWTNVDQATAAAACAAVLDSMGDPMFLCSESEWEAACEAGNGDGVWAFESNPDDYATNNLTCNDATNGFGGPWETGATLACQADTTNGPIYDMSGNVQEWTSTSVTNNGNTYYRVRGGSYQSEGPATACDFSFVLMVPEFLNFDLGFRCCSSNPP